MSIATVRRYFKPNEQRQMEYTCCFGVSQTPPVHLTPNGVTEIPVTFLVSTKQPENGQTGWWDIFVVNVDQHPAGQTLPMADLGDNPNVAPKDMPVAWWQFPKTAPNDNNASDWFASNFEVLMQYDWTPCTSASGSAARAAQSCLRSSKLKLAGRKVKVSVHCATSTPCVGRLKLSTRAKRSRTLASKKIALTAGRTSTVTVSLSRKSLRRLKARRTKVRIQVDLGAAGKATRNATLRRSG